MEEMDSVAASAYALPVPRAPDLPLPIANPEVASFAGEPATGADRGAGAVPDARYAPYPRRVVVQRKPVPGPHTVSSERFGASEGPSGTPSLPADGLSTLPSELAPEERARYDATMASLLAAPGADEEKPEAKPEAVLPGTPDGPPPAESMDAALALLSFARFPVRPWVRQDAEGDVAMGGLPADAGADADVWETTSSLAVELDDRYSWPPSPASSLTSLSGDAVDDAAGQGQATALASGSHPGTRAAAKRASGAAGSSASKKRARAADEGEEGTPGLRLEKGRVPPPRAGGSTPSKDWRDQPKPKLAGPPWVCDPCNRRFAGRGELERHILTTKAHADDRASALETGEGKAPTGWPCPKCARTFTRRDAMERHWLKGTCQAGTAAAVKAKAEDEPAGEPEMSAVAELAAVAADE